MYQVSYDNHDFDFIEIFFYEFIRVNFFLTIIISFLLGFLLCIFIINLNL